MTNVAEALQPRKNELAGRGPDPLLRHGRSYTTETCLSFFFAVKNTPLAETSASSPDISVSRDGSISLSSRGLRYTGGEGSVRKKAEFSTDLLSHHTVTLQNSDFPSFCPLLSTFLVSYISLTISACISTSLASACLIKISPVLSSVGSSSLEMNVELMSAFRTVPHLPSFPLLGRPQSDTTIS